MHAICLLFILLLGQSDQGASDTSTASKLQTIVQLQDQRRGNDPRLARFLSDKSTSVRERAALACASIQDTSLLQELLNQLHDENAAVGEAASFAIGQTGSFLSPAGKLLLEAECLDRISQADSPPRLMEEIGKFGSATALSRLVSFSPSKQSRSEPDALVMGIARFAVRGISSGLALHYLDSIASNRSAVTWQAVYALQRLPPQARSLAPLFLPLVEHKDPLVRMNAAILLGKLGDTLGTSAALVRLSAGDPDWRVRVNATKALALFGSTSAAPVLNRFVDALTDPDEHVVLTALSSFGEMLKDRAHLPDAAQRELWALAENPKANYSIRRQAEAMTALAKIMRSGAFSRLSRIHPAHDWLNARYLVALGLTGDARALPLLQTSTKHRNPMVAASALEGLQYVGEPHRADNRVVSAIVGSALQALESKDISILSTAASLLADSLFRTPEAVPALLRSLERLKEPDDVEAMQQILQTLGSLRDARAVEPLTSKLHAADRTVAEAAASALEEITGQSYRNKVDVHVEKVNSPGRFALPQRLPDTVLVHMKTSAGLVVLELYPKAAPYTVASFLRLSARRFFDGLKFHRVVPNFVVQGGDPRGDGWGGPGYSIRSEFNLLRYERGMLGMASAGKDTEGSQFFITHSPQPHLDGRYTIFGKVRSGMELVDALQVGDSILHVTAASATTTAK